MTRRERRAGRALRIGISEIDSGAVWGLGVELAAADRLVRSETAGFTCRRHEAVSTMHLITEPMPGVKLFELRVFGDDRGSFVETFNRSVLAGHGVDHEFVQDNQSMSVAVGTVRGLHLQLPPHAQGKLVRVLAGSILDVAVDVRPGSSTFGQHCSVTLDAGTGCIFWVPPGFAHGFATLEPDTVVAYKCTATYAPEADRSIRFDDPALGIDWPVASGEAVLSDKDAAAPLLSDLVDDLRAAGW